MAVEFRYRRVGYIALNVTDIDATSDFAVNIWGLDNAGEGPAGERFFRCGHEFQSLALYPGTEPGFVRAGWELETADDVEKAFRHCEQLGLRPRRLAEEERAVLGLRLSEAFRFREPVNGVCFEFYSRMMNVSRPRQNNLTQFRYFSHIGIGAPDVKTSIAYLIDHLGFRASDYGGDYQVAFARPFPVPDHHGFGYQPPRDGKLSYHHLAYFVDSIDDIGRLFHRAENHGVERAWGPSRHPTSGSIALYLVDPDGMIWEATHGMEQFPEVGAREARHMSTDPEDFDLWGAMPKPSFYGAGRVVTDDE